MNLGSLVGHITELLLFTKGSAQPVDRLVSAFFHARTYLGSRDRRFISDEVYRIIRNRRYLEALLEEYVDLVPTAGDLDLPEKRFLALYGISALTLGGRTGEEAVPPSLWTTSFPEVKFDAFSLWMTEHKDLPFLEGKTLLAVRESFQDWMVARWKAQVGKELPELLAALNVPGGVTLRVNAIRSSPEECAVRLALEGVSTHPARYCPEGLLAEKRFNAQASKTFAEGCYEIQDEGSQLVSILAAPRPGDVVIDGCAGAGGKTLHMAAIMGNAGEIIAIDTEPKRLRELEKRSRRAGVKIVRAMLKSDLLPDDLVSAADLVLVDAPCSGSGTIRRNPSFKWTISESLVMHYQEQQLEILAFNARFVKPGGRLAYATCSLFREENDEVVARFLEKEKGFRLLSLKEAAAARGITAEGETLTLFPHRSHTDGFFLALMSRSAR